MFSYLKKLSQTGSRPAQSPSAQATRAPMPSAAGAGPSGPSTLAQVPINAAPRPRQRAANHLATFGEGTVGGFYGSVVTTFDHWQQKHGQHARPSLNIGTGAGIDAAASDPRHADLFRQRLPDLSLHDQRRAFDRLAHVDTDALTSSSDPNTQRAGREFAGIRITQPMRAHGMFAAHRFGEHIREDAGAF